MYQTQDIHVRGTIPLPPPQELREELPASAAAYRQVASAREEVVRILSGEDARMMMVIGPCSIHDPELGLEYARRLKQLADRVSDRMLLIMRVYFEKPRTTVGWKGLINDPNLNDTFDIDKGLRLARRILLDIVGLELATATEMLEPITPQYIADLVAWGAIGARTTESPTHRQMASGLSMPVGFKNGTDGGLDVAINAMQASQAEHSFLGIDGEGKTCIVRTAGNPWGHLILRGGRSGPNYSAKHLADAEAKLTKANLPPRFMVDCSHANSNKDYRKQSVVWNDIIEQRVAGNRTIVGMMVESNLNPGNQKLSGPRESLQPGVSITDGCIGWDETEQLVLTAHERLAGE